VRIGILYPGGRAEERPTVHMAMWSFLNSKIFALEYGKQYEAVGIVQYNEGTGIWEKFKPTPEQIKVCVRATYSWIQQQEHERRWRE
jgi:hypothetical protein